MAHAFTFRLLTAFTYGVLEKKTEAMQLLRRAKAAGYSNENWIHEDADLKCLHGDPEFTALFPSMPSSS